MSVSKPFVFGLVCDVVGPEAAHAKLGANGTGYPFNSLASIEFSKDGRTNPMVNAGAIATTSLAPGISSDDKWTFIHEGLSRFAGRRLKVNDEVYASASQTNFRNRSIARMLQSLDRIYCDPKEATDLYTRQCSLDVTAKDLAVMGATLARRRRGCLSYQRTRRKPHGLPLCSGSNADSRLVRNLWGLGPMRSVFPGKAASAAALSRCRQARAVWAHLRRASTRKETA